MRILAKLLILLCLLIGSSVRAEVFNVLVLPTDIFSVCENYYCFPEVSEIVAEDVITNFNSKGAITAPNLYDVRKKFAENPALKSTAIKVLNKYKTSNSLDFTGLKTLAQNFNSKSVILISSYVQEGMKRSPWEILEISSAFDAINTYTLETNAVLTDNINDIVMWSGKYKKTLGNRDSCFWAKNFAFANSQLEKFKLYSHDNVAKSISQNITLRFFPKTPTAIKPKSVNTEPQNAEFRPNPLGTAHQKHENDFDDFEIDTGETIFTF